MRIEEEFNNQTIQDADKICVAIGKMLSNNKTSELTNLSFEFLIHMKQSFKMLTSGIESAIDRKAHNKECPCMSCESQRQFTKMMG